MFDWDEGDRFSFEDSDRFEEDSLCSWISEPESLCNNWRGWKKQNGNPSTNHHYSGKIKDGQVLSLVELSARIVACHIPFEVVEHVCPPVPEQLQLRIAFWSFPENEEDIRLYSCLANGSADEFQRGDHLFRARAVKELLQIGFHLSATVVPPQTLSVNKGIYNVAVTFDRCRITSCNCTCNSSASWCSHLVAVCLHRIHQPNQVRLRAPVSESLSRLQRDQLQKFAQYLISELPQQQILPTAQRLLDELLSNQQTSINTLPGAPDPTAGASADAQTSWCLDESTLHENIRKILIKLCVPSPMVFSDVNYLSSTAPPAAAEWTSLLRPLRGREPEGMWNLLSIVREMFRRSDRNAIPLLAILTEEVLSCDQILVWWFNTKVSLHTGSGSHGGRANMHSNTHASQHACSSLCDEIVVLWRLAALNPVLSPQDRKAFFSQLHDWHLKTVDKVWKLRNNSSSGASGIRRSDIEVFTGFKPAMEACLLDWSDYPISGITFNEGAARHRFSPYFHPKPLECLFSNSDCETNVCHVVGGFANGGHVAGVPISVYGVGHMGTHSHNHHHTPHCRRGRPLDGVGHWGIIPERRTVLIQGVHCASVSVSRQQGESNRSSLSSEGFCENDALDVSDFLSKPSTSGGLAGLGYQILTDKKGESSSTVTGALAGTSRPVHHLQVQLQPPVSMQGQVQSSEEGPDSGQPSQEESKENDADSDCSTSNGLHVSVENANAAAAATKAVVAESKGEASESQHSSDEYQLYYYDPHTKLSTNEPPAEKKPEEERFVVSVKKIEDPLEVLFARAEALHAHGYTLEACTLAVKLAEQLLVSPPDLMVELPTPANRGKRARRFNPASHQISLLASATLAKTAFLCSVLSENMEHHHLAFCVGLFGLEMARPPASTKALEVKLANQEQDIVLLLKRIPLMEAELRIVKERAEQLRDGHLKSRGEALLPLMLASYIFDALVLSGNSNHGTQLPAGKISTEENLGFEAVVAALGLKANVSEAEHPLLCEGIRRQRGDLAIGLVVHYKDDQEKLAKIMDKLLDKDVHQMYKAPSLNPYYYNSASSQGGTNGSGESCAAGGDGSSSGSCHRHESGESADLTPNVSESVTPHLPEEGDLKSYDAEYLTMLEVEQQTEALKLTTILCGENGSSSVSSCPMLSSRGEQGEGTTSNGAAARLGPENHRHGHRLCSVRSDGASSPGWEEDYKAWEAKFRCTNFRTNKKHSAGMASIDSSAPETTSSDNSPTVVRKSTLWKPTGPGSDSGSSGESSDSFASSSSGDKVTRPILRDADSPPQSMLTARLSTSFVPTENVSRTVTANTKTTRFKGKRVYPSVPNQPSEASAHFMFELAKTVLTKAGGNSSTAVLFTQPSSSQNHRCPHRGLHMCAFQIGLYALGLHNAVSPNWLSRTYSSHVSWITGQAMEIGSAAISFLIDTWEGHLTPPEVASLADRASRGRDPAMVRSAAELALSCLPHAHALNPNEIQRALIQCKEQSGEMLERACLAVETAAKGGGVYPEVLFDVARRWHELYEDSLHHPAPRSGRGRGGLARIPEPSEPSYLTGTQQQPQQQQSQHQQQQQQQSQQPQQQQQAQQQQQQAQQGPSPIEQPTGLPLQQQQGPCLPSVTTAGPSLAPLLETRPMAHLEGLVTSPSPSLTTVLPQLACAPVSYALPYNHPYTYLQGLPPFLHAPLPFHPAAGYTYVPLNPSPYYPVGAHLRPQNPALYPGQVIGVSPPSQGTIPQPRSVLPLTTPPPAPPTSIPSPPQPQVNGSVPQLNQRQLGYLLSAYRVGMLAMETLARRVHDDRPLAKYARNPSYGEDVKWLLEVAKKLGTSYLQEFCICTVNSVASPFILHEIVLESAHYLARSGSATLTQPLRSHLLTPLIQKCQQMFIACTHFKMYHITSTEYDEFVSIIRSARTAFQLTPGGMVQFNELLQSLRRSKSCKKELWQRIANALATTTI